MARRSKISKCEDLVVRLSTKPPGFVVVDSVVTVDGVEDSVVDSLVNDGVPVEREESVMNVTKPVVMFAKVIGRTVELCDIFAAVVGGAVELYNTVNRFQPRQRRVYRESLLPVSRVEFFRLALHYFILFDNVWNEHCQSDT